MPIKITPIEPDAFAPLYQRPEGRNAPGRAFVELDEEGGVRLVVDEDTSGNDPEAVWQGRALRWSVPATMTAEEANDLLDAIAPLLERVHAGHRVAFDGRNTAGALSDDALAAKEAVLDACGLAQGSVSVHDPRDWLFPEDVATGAADLGLTAHSSDAEIDALAESCIEDARREGAFLDGDVAACLRDARDALALSAEERSAEDYTGPTGTFH